MKEKTNLNLLPPDAPTLAYVFTWEIRGAGRKAGGRNKLETSGQYAKRGAGTVVDCVRR